MGGAGCGGDRGAGAGASVCACTDGGACVGAGAGDWGLDRSSLLWRELGRGEDLPDAERDAIADELTESLAGGGETGRRKAGAG